MTPYEMTALLAQLTAGWENEVVQFKEAATVTRPTRSALFSDATRSTELHKRYASDGLWTPENQATSCIGARRRKQDQQVGKV